MKKLILLVATLLLTLRGSAQAVNPQSTFSNAVNAGNPSLWLNFNDATTSFTDAVSNTAFTGAAYSAPSYKSSCVNNPTSSASSTICALTASAGDGAVLFIKGTISAITSLTDSGGAIATQAFSYGTVESVWYFTSLSAGSHTFTVTFASAQSYPILQATDIANMSSVSPIDAHSANSTTSSSTTWTSGSLTTSVNPSELLVGFVLGSSNTYTLTAPVFTAQSEGLWTGIFQAHYTTSSVGSYAFTGNMSNAGGYTALIVAVKGQAQNPTALARQAGFDSTNNANYSAAFPYNSFNIAPNTTLSAIEWNKPWTMLLQVDRLNWDHVSPVVLASKGDLNSGVWWKVYLQTNSANTNGSQLCFGRQSNNTGPFTAVQAYCSATSIDAMPNGFNYDIVIADNGSGGGGAINMWINGTAQAMAGSTGSALGFGGVSVAVSGGTGYAASTAYTSVGGGASCIVQGTMAATSGVPTSASSSGANQNYGCSPTTFTATGSGTNLTVAAVSSGVVTVGGTISGTGVPVGTTIVSQTSGVTGGAGVYVTSASTTAASAAVAEVPTVVLTSPTGTGATLTATTYAMTMNSTVGPLVVPGFLINAVYYGPGGSDTTQNPVYMDEFVEFPGNLTFGQITNLFYETKFYQSLLYSYAKPPKVILEGSGCGPDFSGDQTMGMVIGAHKAGLIQLLGAVDDDGNANGSNSVGWWRQILDQAGLNDVAVSVGPVSPTANVGGCPAASITAYNASTPQNASSYESSVTMYRTMLAANPTTPVHLLLTQGLNGYTAFLQSPADSISPLTGLQLAAQNRANGAVVNLFEGNLGLTPTALTYLLNNNGGQYLQVMGGTPASGGPGIEVSRTVLDPLYTAAINTSGDTVAGWTNMQIAQLLSPYFFGGVLLSGTGGTGYAAQTNFTSTGGGPSCNVRGYFLSSSGVPNGTNFYNAWGGSAITGSSMYDGIGYGCTPAVFTGTGSGTSLTVSAVAFGVITVGDTLSGAGVPTGTSITGQVSGTTGGLGVYTTSVATTASAATLTRTPTIVLTSPTGTGFAITAALTFTPEGYGGNNTNQFRVSPSAWAQSSSVGTGNAPVFTWFQNSLMDPPTTGAPRPY